MVLSKKTLPRHKATVAQVPDTGTLPWDKGLRPPKRSDQPNKSRRRVRRASCMTSRARPNWHEPTGGKQRPGFGKVSAGPKDSPPTTTSWSPERHPGISATSASQQGAEPCRLRRLPMEAHRPVAASYIPAPNGQSEGKWGNQVRPSPVVVGPPIPPTPSLLPGARVAHPMPNWTS